jgi:dTDP-4-dehydrorhamnose reductase
MKWLITGLNGTLAPVLAQKAEALAVEVLAWDRNRLPPDDVATADAWLRHERPDAIAHLGMGSADWAGRLARYAAEHGKSFVFTSTAMVFHHVPNGPHAVDDDRNAQDPYGQYKRECEDAILASHPGASVVRIGWQIDAVRTGNNMLMALDQWQATQGKVSASRVWKPACSFMIDTAAALARLLLEPVPGVSHVDSNAQEGHDFAQIARALKVAFHRDAWDIHVHEDYAHDQRLLGGGALVPPLSARLASLQPKIRNSV